MSFVIGCLVGSVLASLACAWVCTTDWYGRYLKHLEER
jgi:hypothetical protein